MAEASCLFQIHENTEYLLHRVFVSQNFGDWHTSGGVVTAYGQDPSRVYSDVLVHDEEDDLTGHY